MADDDDQRASARRTAMAILAGLIAMVVLVGLVTVVDRSLDRSGDTPRVVSRSEVTDQGSASPVIACSSRGMTVPDQPGLPAAVAQTRQTFLDLAAACDIEGLRTFLADQASEALLASEGSASEGRVSSVVADTVVQLIDPEGHGSPTLAAVTSALGSSYVCGETPPGATRVARCTWILLGHADYPDVSPALSVIINDPAGFLVGFSQLVDPGVPPCVWPKFLLPIEGLTVFGEPFGRDLHELSEYEGRFWSGEPVAEDAMPADWPARCK